MPGELHRKASYALFAKGLGAEVTKVRGLVPAYSGASQDGSRLSLSRRRTSMKQRRTSLNTSMKLLPGLSGLRPSDADSTPSTPGRKRLSAAPLPPGLVMNQKASLVAFAECTSGSVRSLVEGEAGEHTPPRLPKIESTGSCEVPSEKRASKTGIQSSGNDGAPSSKRPTKMENV
eukprot:4473462-Prymnesium_polylepis.1